MKSIPELSPWRKCVLFILNVVELVTLNVLTVCSWLWRKSVDYRAPTPIRVYKFPFRNSQGCEGFRMEFGFSIAFVTYALVVGLLIARVLHRFGLL